MALEFRLFGEFEVRAGDQRLPLGGAKQRSVLAILALHRGSVVSTDRLIDGIWGERPPATASKTLQVYVSHLRKVLGAEVLVTRAGGYSLEIAPEQLDRDRFERLAAEGHRSLAADDPAAAARLLSEAFELWTGPPLADFSYETFAQAEIARLDEVRLGALEDRFDAELALGHHARICSELDALVAEHPLRERLQAQLMLALYRCGRQADALERYRTARETMREQLGVEPGRELAAMQAAILAHDPDLTPPRRSALDLPSARSSRARAAAVGIAAVALVGVAIAAIAGGGSDDPATAVAPNSVAVLDPQSGAVVASVPVGARPAQIAASDEAVFVANFDDRSVSELDSETTTVTATTPVGSTIDGIAAGSGGVWLTDVQRGTVSRLDPSFDRVVERVRVSSGADLFRVRGPIAATEDAVWAADGRAAVVAVDPASLRVSKRANVGNDPAAIAVAGDAVWVADDLDNTVSRVDAGTGTVSATIPVGPSPSAIDADTDGVWVAVTGVDQVLRLDPASGAVVATIGVGDAPTGVEITESGVWVANSGDGTLSRIDLESNAVDQTVAIGQSPQDVVLADGRLWVATAAGTPTVAGSSGDGGVVRVVSNQDLADTDPAQYFTDIQRAHATCAQLYDYPDEAAPRGTALTPEVAAGEPVVSDGGREWRFAIRPGFGFSPPSTEEVTAASFERQIYRVLSPRLKSYGATTVTDIVGARAYRSGDSKRIAGVSVEGGELVIRLRQPSADLATRISTPWFCAVPRDTPIAPLGAHPVPAAGPYYTAEYTPERRLTLLRNPNYGGEREAVPERIEYEFGVTPRAAVEAVGTGEADLYSNAAIGNTFDAEAAAELEARYGPDSAAAREGDQRLFVTPQLGVYYLVFNTQRPPFDDPAVRRAVNFAIDRRELTRYPFLSETSRPTDQFLPPGLPGFSDEAIYPLGGPDLERARQLAGDVDARVVLYVCNLVPCRQFGEAVRAELAPLGLDVEVRQFAIPELFNRIASPGERFDLAQFNYYADYPDPSNFVNSQFETGRSLNPGLFADPELDRRMAAASQLTGDARLRAYAELDRDLAAEAAPAVPFASATTVSFFSERVGCQLNQPVYGIALNLLCER